MFFCFGTYINILLMCVLDSTDKIDLVNVVVQSVDRQCKLKSNAVTALLKCETRLPDGKRANSLGEVVPKAQTVNPKKVADYFRDKVIPFINPKRRMLAVCAIRDIIMNDETITDETVVVSVDSTTKKALRVQRLFALSDFLAGVFLFATTVNNREGKETLPAITEEYILSFESESKTMGFKPPNPSKTTIMDNTEVFDKYMARAEIKNNTTKTLLFKDMPMPFYDIYIPNDVDYPCKQIVMGKQTVRVPRGWDTLSDVTVKHLTAISNFLILVGTGGLGKSMMMTHLFLNAIEDFATLQLAPVLIPLKGYGESSDNLSDYIYKQVTNHNSEISKEIFTGALNDGSFLLLLDGLDEIEGNYAGRFERALDTFTDTYPNNYYIISSRPSQTFIAIGRFSILKLCPFTKSQALALVDKLDFEPDHPEIKEKFQEMLDKYLYESHKSFAQVPLLLSIMMLTFKYYADVPTKMHIFYREAFQVLFDKHDANKGAYRREFKSGLNFDDFSGIFAEICFRSYRDEKYELTDIEFAEYYKKSLKSEKRVSASDYMHDLCKNLCVMFDEGSKYHFVHRSFQEYFAAVFMSKQKDEFIRKLGDFFEARAERRFSNYAFSLLYDIIPDKVEEFIFIPYISSLFYECDQKDGYWSFLESVFPIFRYTHGDVDETVYTEPKPYLFLFIMPHINLFCKTNTYDLPFDKRLVIDEYTEDKGPLVVIDTNKTPTGEIFHWPYYELAEGEIPPEPEVVGWLLECNIAEIRKETDSYAELLEELDDDGFIFKALYLAARRYLGLLTVKHRRRSDDLLDLL